jgi:hypothetical protein
MLGVRFRALIGDTSFAVILVKAFINRPWVSYPIVELSGVAQQQDGSAKRPRTCLGKESACRRNLAVSGRPILPRGGVSVEGRTGDGLHSTVPCRLARASQASPPWGYDSPQFLEVSLCDQAFHITLPYIELAILRQINGPARIVS